MNFKQLEYFVAVADAGSISSAARSLHISQPPLSTQMHLLEEELGQSLFERGSRSIKLTDAGRFFYERAQSILDMAEGTRKDMEQLGKGLIGALRLGMISSVQTGPVIESISRFRQNHPGVLFRIHRPDSRGPGPHAISRGWSGMPVSGSGTHGCGGTGIFFRK